MSETAKEIIIAYIPAIHAGYLDLMERHAAADIGVLGGDFTDDLNYLHKEIRALPSDKTVAILRGIGKNATVLSMSQLPRINEMYDTIILPKDDVSTHIEKNFDKTVIYEPIFLRWDRHNSHINQEVNADRIITLDDLEAAPIATALTEAEKSSSWWRHVGAAITDKQGQVLLSAHNGALPTEYSNWVDGDPRNTAQRGKDMDLSNEIHAEARLIAEAARKGIRLESLSLYASTFPCPSCAKLIAKSGITTCYFSEAYAVLDGHEIMRQAGIELVQVEGAALEEDPNSLRPYTKG